MSQNAGAPRDPSIFDRSFLTDAEDVTEIILVRHGQQHVADWRGGPLGETFDPPLSERGREQARLVGMRFSTERLDAVYASPLVRALETGQAIARHHRLVPVVVDDLHEIKIFHELPPDRPAEAVLGADLLAGIRERMIREKRWDVYPHSESSFAFRKRTVNAVEAIIAANPGKRVVVACHGGVINAFIAHVIGLDYDMFFRPAHTSVNIVYAAAGGVRALQSLNDVTHLRVGEESFVTHF